jgi:hypothetical protein
MLVVMTAIMVRAVITVMTMLVVMVVVMTVIVVVAPRCGGAMPVVSLGRRHGAHSQPVATIALDSPAQLRGM